MLAQKYALLDEAEERILANDSCYAPIYPFEQMFDKMAETNSDFWGITQNQFGIMKVNNKYKSANISHLQSYFLVFKKEVFNSSCFINFMNGIQKEANKQDIIIKYEIGLTQELKKNGFDCDYYIKGFEHISDPTLRKWREIIKDKKCPVIKTSVMRLNNLKITYPFSWAKVIKSKNEDLFNIIDAEYSKIQWKPLKVLVYLFYMRRKLIRIHVGDSTIFIGGFPISILSKR